jgi:energy-coupling factor transporter ATP-binding protein EcfA2
MPDNGNKTRPVRTLTVKNFSVIKEAKLEFGKITVLIGPQASGKSLLGKLAYFLSKEVLERAVDSILRGAALEEFTSVMLKQFSKQFGAAISESPYEVAFTEGQYKVSFSGDRQDEAGTRLIGNDLFSKEFKILYSVLLGKQSETELTGGKSRQDQQDEVWSELNLLLTAPFVCEALYIPAGRAFFTDTSKGYAALRNMDLDPIIRQFASEISWNTRWRVGQVTAGDGVLEGIRKSMVQIARGQVVAATDQPLFRGLEGRDLPLTLLSSGTQELLPLFNVLDRLASSQEHREVSRNATRIPAFDESPVGSKKLIYLEEPEANVFPSTQCDLVRLFARLSREPNLDFSWVITTHSPYVLTAFNDLIKAGNIAAQRPDKVAEIEKIVPGKYWIKPGDFAAYAFDGKDGVLRSIMDDETKMINGDTLDDISEKISEEFGQLLEIQYGD